MAIRPVTSRVRRQRRFNHVLAVLGFPHQAVRESSAHRQRAHHDKHHRHGRIRNLGQRRQGTSPPPQPQTKTAKSFQTPSSQVFLLDHVTHKVRRSYKGHASTVHSICWEPSLKLILTASLASEIVGFSPYSDRELFRLVKHLVPVTGLCVRARKCGGHVSAKRQDISGV